MRYLFLLFLFIGIANADTYFAQVDSSGVVTYVTSMDSTKTSQQAHDWLVANRGGTWIESFLGGGTRKNAAVAGGTYSQSADVFIDPQPSPFHTLDYTSYQWIAPYVAPSVSGVP